MEKQYILDAVDAEMLESRRSALKKIGLGVAAASVPLTFASLSRDAFAQSTDPQALITALNFLVILKYLEADFYTQGIAAAGLIPASDLPVFQQIVKHETAHVDFLTSTVTTLGGVAATRPSFSFNAKGGLPDPFDPANYQVFLGLAQAFEDLGVRMYKGQVPNLMGNRDVLTAVMQIHSMEARHAAEVRRLRGQKGWITGDTVDAGIPATVRSIYLGEENVTQSTADITALPGVSGAAVATEAFDEPIGKASVLLFFKVFIA